MRVPDELRRCRAVHAQLGLQCEDQVTEMTVHTGDHWAAQPNGGRIRWTDLVSVYCKCGPGGHTLTGGCLPVGNGSARLSQVGGGHYKKFKIQPWDVIDEYQLGFYAGNALKYLLRAGHKDAKIQDLKKCRHYLDKLIELEEARGE